MNVTKENNSQTKVILKRTYPVLKRPMISLNDYDYLTDSDMDLNIANKSLYSLNQSDTSPEKAIMLKIEKQLIILLRIVKNKFKSIEEDKMKASLHDEIIIEWKEAARRLEIIFFIASFIIIVLTPFLMFGKFFFRDIAIGNTEEKCACFH